MLLVNQVDVLDPEGQVKVLDLVLQSQVVINICGIGSL